MARKNKRAKTTKRRRVGDGAGLCGPFAQALAEFLENPRPMHSGDEAGGAVETLLRSIAEAVDKRMSGLTTDGSIFEIADETLPLLNRALGYAMKARQGSDRERGKPPEGFEGVRE